MKFIITLFSIFFLLTTAIFCQQTSYQKTFDWADDFVPENMFILDDVLYLPVLIYNEGDVGFTTVYKINKTGETIDSIQIIEGIYCWIYEIQEVNNHLRAFASITYSEEEGADFAIFDLTYDLELIESNQYPTPYRGYNRMHGFTNNAGNHVIIGDFSTNSSSPEGQYYDIRIMEISPEKNIVKDTIYSRSGGQVVFGADYSEYRNTYHLHTKYNFDPDFFDQIQYNIIDSNYHLSYTSEISSPVHFFGYSTIKIIDSAYLYQAGDVYAYEGTFYNAYGICKFNYEYELQNYKIINYNTDTNNIAGFYKCFDYTDKNSLYFIGTKNYSLFQDQNSYINIVKLDSNLNILWHKYYGGDRAYFANEVKALEDGGCLITSFYKDAPNFDKRRIILLKFDENGLITSTDNDMDIPMKNAIVLPNPGTDYLQLHTGIYPATFKLFNINGQLILEEEINSETNQINTSYLKTGTYIWQLIKEGQEVESGKWVKE